DGDFEKIMGLVGLKYSPDPSHAAKYFRWIHTTFAFVEPNWWRSGYRTSETVLVRAAMAISRLVGNGRLFDLRWLGGLHAILLLLSLRVILGSRRPEEPFVRRFALAAAGVFFFTDVGYAAPMNSLYSQEASFLALFGALATLARALTRGWTVTSTIAFFGCAA